MYQARNDAVPRGVYVSPRLGFSWTYGTNPQIGGFEGAQRGSRGQISGGIGQFQNLPSSQLIAAAVDQTGLPVGGAAVELHRQRRARRPIGCSICRTPG